MDDTEVRTMLLSAKGYYCSQIILTLGLEAQGERNPGLVRAAAGVALGAGRGAGTCGCLEGAACLLALHAAKGADEEEEDGLYWTLVSELWDWFGVTVGSLYGGVECDKILADGTPRRERCGPIVAQTYGKAMEILVCHGFDPTERKGR